MTSRFEEQLTLAGEAATESLGKRLALWARPNMLIRLYGPLGSGKSTLARAFIRSLMNTESDIPSPTFSLIQTYEDARVPVFHADLYRLQTSDEVLELGFENLLLGHAGLVEWPDLLPELQGADFLDITFEGRGESRSVKLVGRGAWATALERDQQLSSFLSQTEFRGAQRFFFEGDASSRRYETLVLDDTSQCLLMDMPQRPDGPPVKNGKPYSAIAHIAENITSVVAINTHLVAAGYSAPRILASDLKHGFGLIEPLGNQVYGRMILAGHDMREPLEEAAHVLARMAQQSWPRHPEASKGVQHTVHDYDLEAQLMEVDLLPSWFIPHVRGVAASDEQKQSFAAIWHDLLQFAQPDKPLWTIRDYHSPNLLWIPDRKGFQRVGIIDSQDAVMGHAAYDLVSLGQDARVDVLPALEDHLFDHYCSLRRAQGAFDREAFATAYAILGAQRASKILGIFARLNKRDGKPAYLRHMPRVSRYLARNLANPVLSPLRAWFEIHAPEALQVQP